MQLSDYRPRTALRRDEHPVSTPRFPVIDAHNHLGPEFSHGWSAKPVTDVLAAMDEAGVECAVDLDGEQGDALEAHLDRYQRPHPERFITFAGLAYDRWSERPDFGEREAERLEASARQGARGLKVWKTLGLRATGPDGRLVAVDDARLDPLWAAAARLGLPVLIHVADPVAFFEPLDEHNERWEELQAHPDWHFWPTRHQPDDPGFPRYDELIDGLDRLLGRHPETTFVGAHVGCAPEDLDRVAGMLERHPNFAIDIAARIAELGRQPYRARELITRFGDRVLFGTDEGYDPAMYRIHYRFLETRDESFDYSTVDPPPQGRWQIHGLGLPDEVLRKVYADNARRVLRLD